MSQYMWGEEKTQFFFNLTPEIILKHVESVGLRCSGRCLTLNSMENRVYEIEVESGDDTSFVIAKFYRPGRWTREQILEEHQFLFDLKEAQIPVIAPLYYAQQSLFYAADINLFFCLFPKMGGRVNTELSFEQLEVIGRTLARLHNVGEQRKVGHRLTLNAENFGTKNLDFLMNHKIIPHHIELAFRQVVESVIVEAKKLFVGKKNIRLHGDCHWGNIIWRDQTSALLIDFDDMIYGPSIQDLWLIVPGGDSYSLQDREILLESYQSMRSFDRTELKLIEPLRALRFLHFSAWIAKRWDDPYFKRAFPQFAELQYWENQLKDMRQQLELF